MVRHTDTTEDEPIDAHDLSEGDRVEIEATPIRKDEPGTVAGEVVDATVHTMEMGDGDDEVGQTVKVRADTGTLYVRNGAGTLSVVDDDGFHVTIAWDSTLCRERTTDGGDDIIVAGDDGVILPDEDDDRQAHPDDEGVEILTDGGTDVDPDAPECESCGHLTAEEPSNRGDRVCTFCGCYTDDDGNLPRSDDKRCGKCHGPVAYGPFKDARKGIRGYWCPSCDLMVSTDDEPPVATDGGHDVTVAVEHDDHEHTVGLERFEAGFVALLIASSRNTIDSPDVDEDRVDDVYAAFMSPVTSTHDDGLRADGGKPPGEDVSIAPNYEAGGVWFTLGDLPRRLLSPSDARAVADHVEDAFGPTPDGYDDVGDMATELRRLADEVEEKVDDPHVAAFDDIPLTE